MNWWDELDYLENPFTIKPRQKFEEFIGQEITIKKILKDVEKGKIITIKGEFGVGKSSILKSIIKKYEGKKVVCYIDAHKKNLDLNVQKISENAGGFFSKTFKIQTKNMILLVDEAQNLSQQEIQTLVSEHKKVFKTIVFATSKPDLVIQNSTNNYYLQKFTLENAKELVKNRLNGEQLLPDVVIQKLYEKSQTPRTFLQLCDDTMKNAVSKGKQEATLSDT